jgi:transcriptional regulator with XRE-family HTH domain
MNIVGTRLRSLRESLHLSQKQIAEVIDCTQSAVYRYENGKAEPPIKTMLWYADYFDVSMDYIYGRTDNPQGKLYKYEPKAFKERLKNQEEWAQFVEMCFDPDSPMSARLKETMMQMMGADKK